MSSTKINKLLAYFFIYSFIGWILETLYSYIVLGYFDNRGFLIGPVCPIYGFGMLILILLLSRYENNLAKLFFVSGIVLTLFEYLTGYALDAVFQLKWWDYSNDFLNINGRICLPYALIWGLGSVIAIKFIHPHIVNFMKFFYQKCPRLFNPTILKILIILLIADFVLSCMQYAEISSYLPSLHLTFANLIFKS